jgi:hypothetical protein
MVQNGSFESASSPWTLKVTSPAAGSLTTDTTTAADGTASAKVTISTASSAGWNLQFRQDNLNLTAGKKYTVTFSAKASSSRSIEPVLQQQVSPFTLYVDQGANLTTSWQSYSYTYTASTTGAVFLGFNVGNYTGTVWIDKVSMVAN